MQKTRSITIKGWVVVWIVLLAWWLIHLVRQLIRGA